MAAEVIASIVTLTDRNPEELVETLESIAMQNYDRIQLVVVNSQSTIDDEFYRIINMRRWHSVVLISSSNDGIYKSMNRAVGYCVGDILCFMNSGDSFVNKTAILNVVNSVDHSKSIFVMKLKGAFKCQRLFNGFVLNNICQQTVFYNLAKIGSCLKFDPNYRLSADLDLLVKVYISDTQEFAAYCPQSIIYYRPGGVSSNRKLLLVEKREILKKYQYELGLFRFTLSIIHLWFVSALTFLELHFDRGVT